MNRLTSQSLVAALLVLGCSAVVAQPPEPMSVATALSQAFAQAAQKISPAVANISTTTVIPGRASPASRWLEDVFGPGAFTTPAQEVHSLGSGVVIRADGYVATNYHVVRDAQSIVVALGGETEMPATVRGSDPAADLAVVKVEATGLPAARWGNSDALQVGEWVIAIGSPLGLQHSVTAGIVSAKGRCDVGICTVEDFIQTDCTINPGNSGGALANLRGEVVGIPTAILSESGGSEGVGFAIPSNVASVVTKALIEQGRYPRGWVGIMPGPVSRRRAQAAGLREGIGLVVGSLYRDSPAHRAGLQPGDIIVSCNGQEVSGLSVLVQAVAQAGTHGTLKLDYVRLVRQGEGIARTSGTAQVSIVPQPVGQDGKTPQGV
jgi:serine protease Do